MNTIRLILAALIVLCLVMIWHLSPARADGVPCDALQPMLDRLAKNYGEFPVMRGALINGKQMIVTFSNKGSFSLIESDGNVACMVAAGDKAELDKGI